MKNIIKTFLLISLLNTNNIFTADVAVAKSTQVVEVIKSFGEKVKEYVKAHPVIVTSTVLAGVAGGFGLGYAYKKYHEHEVENNLVKSFNDVKEFKKFKASDLKRHLEKEKEKLSYSIRALTELRSNFNLLKENPSLIYSENFVKKIPSHTLIYLKNIVSNNPERLKEEAATLYGSVDKLIYPSTRHLEFINNNLSNTQSLITNADNGGSKILAILLHMEKIIKEANSILEKK